MVDAVNAINGATQSIIHYKKTASIDWRNLTANQVLEYAGQGEDVPPDILKWAQDYSKLVNAPDDVSYDSVNGSTNLEEVHAYTAGTDGVSASDSADKNAKENDEIEDEENPIDAYDFAGDMINESAAATITMNDISDDSEKKAENSTRIASLAAERANEAEDRAKSVRDEYDQLVSKLQGDKSKITPEDLRKLDRLADLLTSIGTAAQNQLTAFDIQLQEIEEVFAQYAEQPPNASTTGEDTVEVGALLVANSPEDIGEIKNKAIENAGKGAAKAALKKAHIDNWKFIFNRNYKRGVLAISYGGGALDASENAKSTLAASSDTNKESISANRNAMDKVEDITFVKGRMAEVIQNDSESGSDDNNNENIETKVNKNSSANKTDLKGIKDDTLLTDAQELRRRKEMRGEIEPPA